MFWTQISLTPKLNSFHSILCQFRGYWPLALSSSVAYWSGAHDQISRRLSPKTEVFFLTVISPWNPFPLGWEEGETWAKCEKRSGRYRLPLIELIKSWDKREYSQWYCKSVVRWQTVATLGSIAYLLTYPITMLYTWN